MRVQRSRTDGQLTNYVTVLSWSTQTVGVTTQPALQWEALIRSRCLHISFSRTSMLSGSQTSAILCISYFHFPPCQLSQTTLKLEASWLLCPFPSRLLCDIVGGQLGVVPEARPVRVLPADPLRQQDSAALLGNSLVFLLYFRAQMKGN